MGEAGLARMMLPAWYDGGMAQAPAPAAPFPEPPPSRQDQAFNTSIDRWKQLAKDVFFGPADALRAFNEKPTFMNSLGIMPMGTFGGRLAKTANQDAVALARAMTARGASREAVWDKTGWFQGPDQKWRFEIPDNTAKYNPTPELNGTRVKANTVGMALDHPELFAAYPDLANVKFTDSWKPNGAYYSKDRNTIGLGPSHPSADKSLLLHEAQHFVQEGPDAFAHGGAPSRIPQDMIAQERARMAAKAAEEKPSWTRVGTSTSDAPDWSIAHDLYRRIAGEVEARAVQNRMNLTPEQRRARYPWLDYDVPIEQQIVK